jgi:hypothetical protein
LTRNVGFGSPLGGEDKVQGLLGIAASDDGRKCACLRSVVEHPTEVRDGDEWLAGEGNNVIELEKRQVERVGIDHPHADIQRFEHILTFRANILGFFHACADSLPSKWRWRLILPASVLRRIGWGGPDQRWHGPIL